LVKAIVGIEIILTKVVGKWKVSQNQPERNRRGVIDGLGVRNQNDDASMAELIARHSGGGATNGAGNN
jgi:transcriptional regulator